MKTLLASIALVGFASAASADEWEQRAFVQDHYTKMTYNVMEYQTVCENVTHNGNAAASALGGMIIGGIIGKATTGTDSGATAGAVLGGVIGADRGSQNQGTRQECRNVPVNRPVSETVYSHSTIRFWHNNRWVELEFYR